MRIRSSIIIKGLFSSLLFMSYQSLSNELPDTCATQGPSNSINDGTPVCVSNNGTAYLSLGGANAHNSVAISTAHGSGDLGLYGWPRKLAKHCGKQQRLQISKCKH